MRVLLIEDNEILGDAIQSYLTMKRDDQQNVKDRYTVDWVKDGLQASYVIDKEIFDVIILDLGIPKRSGFDVLQRMREKKNNTPVIILTANDTIEDKIRGLDTGADHYLTKPTDLRELASHIRSLQRRISNRTENTLSLGNVSLNPENFEVRIDENSIEISRKEFSILHILMDKKEQTVTREKLSQSVYGWSGDIDSNTIEVYVHNLRKKLDTTNIAIKTVRGIGYILTKKT